MPRKLSEENRLDVATRVRGLQRRVSRTARLTVGEELNTDAASRVSKRLDR